MYSCVLLLFYFFLSVSLFAQTGRSLSGRIEAETLMAGKIVVQLFKLNEHKNGRPYSLTKADIYGDKQPERSITLSGPERFSFAGLKPGWYAVVAFQDMNGDGMVSFDPPEPFGWFSSRNGERFSSIDLQQEDMNNADILLRRTTPFPPTEKRTDHGVLKRIKGLTVLQLHGTAAERGFAHGYLMARQIIEFFEFYVLEDSWRTPERYETSFVPFLEKNFDYPAEYLKECDAVVSGMKASGVDLTVRFLGREFRRTDLLAINAYIERRAAFPVKTIESCTQFAFWGEMTKNSPLNGGLVAARNMDGECDVRKVTVSHFLLFAVTPTEPGRNRWVSGMWPGFVGTITGINEMGLYSMENAGASGPGPVPNGLTPCSWIQRYVLEQAGADATPESILNIMKLFTGSGGGITAAGSIILWAVPYHGQPAPSFVFEGGRSGYAMRLPGETHPKNPFVIMASNHHKKFGFDPEQPDHSLGLPVSFSSLWRYEAGRQKLEAWNRLRMPLTVEHAKRLLQTVAHGTTEYAMIFSANEKKIYVAVDDLKTDLWDAPYLTWQMFDFEELFH